MTQLVEAGARARCLTATDWSANGRYLIVDRETGEDAPYRSIAAHDLSADSLIALVEVAADAQEGTLSPDMRWLAYRSSESGTSEILVRPFLRPGRPIPVSLEGGRSPQWRADGRELYFEAPDGRIMAAAVTGGADFEVNSLTMLFRAPGWTRPLFFDRGTSYDVSPDGQLFAVRLTASGTSAVLVQNWMTRLR